MATNKAVLIALGAAGIVGVGALVLSSREAKAASSESRRRWRLYGAAFGDVLQCGVSVTKTIEAIAASGGSNVMQVANVAPPPGVSVPPANCYFTLEADFAAWKKGEIPSGTNIYYGELIAKDPTNPPDWVRWAVQQAIASGDPRLMRAAADVLEGQGWPAQAKNLREHADAAPPPTSALPPSAFPILTGNSGGKANVRAGSYLAYAALSWAQCLVPNSIIRDDLASRPGVVNVSVENVERNQMAIPAGTTVPDASCYLQVSFDYNGPAKTVDVPPEVFHLEFRPYAQTA